MKYTNKNACKSLIYRHLVEMRGVEPRSRTGKPCAFYMLIRDQIFELNKVHGGPASKPQILVSRWISVSLFQPALICDTPEPNHQCVGWRDDGICQILRIKQPWRKYFRQLLFERYYLREVPPAPDMLTHRIPTRCQFQSPPKRRRNKPVKNHPAGCWQQTMIRAGQFPCVWNYLLHNI